MCITCVCCLVCITNCILNFVSCHSLADNTMLMNSLQSKDIQNLLNNANTTIKEDDQ